MASQIPLNSARRFCAMALGMVTALCTMGWFLSLALTMFELKRAGIGPTPPFYPGIIEVIGLAATLPLAVICTAVAIFLVGPRRSKLAWISLCVYFFPFIVGLLMALVKRMGER